MPKHHSSLFITAQRNLRHMILMVKARLWRESRSIRSMGHFLMLVSALASLGCLVVMAVHSGFDHSATGYRTLRNLMAAFRWIFGINVIYSLTLNLPYTLKNSRWLKWVVDIAMLISLLPAIYPQPVHPWLPWLGQVLYSTAFTYSILAAYSSVTLCYAVFHIIDRRTNPSLILSLSFAVLIAIGTLLLMLPKSTVNGISPVNALFVSASAVCVTGLTPVDVAATFTPLGLGILAALIQMGALGVMTFTSFFALFFSGSASIYSQLMLRDVIYSKSMNSLLPTLLYILAFTVSVEIVGAALIFLSIHGTLHMDITQELVFSAFHSLSAFCNAGFSNLPGGMANPMLLGKNIPVYWVMSFLICAGSIGFPILVNLKDAVVSWGIRHLHRYTKQTTSPRRTVHTYNMNTKIVVFTSSLFLIAGAIMFFILEYSNSLAGMSLTEKITQSVFNSAVPRSAGFSSVNPAGFLNVTLVMILFFMWVGGGSQSTGGGVKVNTVAAIWLNLKAIVTNASNVTAFKRSIAVGSIRRANAVVAISIFSYFLLSFLLLGLEPDLPARGLLFESCSALFTVGSSLGITSSLSDASKLLLCVAMFLGRVGIISLLMGVVTRNNDTQPAYPPDNIIIN